MSREEDPAAPPGPQVVGSATRSDSPPHSNHVVFLLSDARAIEEGCQISRGGILHGELRGCGAVEAESPLAWKSCGLRAPSDYGNSPESSVAATAGSPRSGAESDVPYKDAFESGVDGPCNRADYLRGVDPKNNSATLESYVQSSYDFSAELPSNLQETGSGQVELEDGVEEGISGLEVNDIGRGAASADASAVTDREAGRQT